MDSKAAISSNRKMAAATMDSCRRQCKGNPCPARSDAEAMIFYWSHHTPGGCIEVRRWFLSGFHTARCSLQNSILLEVSLLFSLKISWIPMLLVKAEPDCCTFYLRIL